MDAKQEIAELRRLIKWFVQGISVKNGRGTAWGWIEIRGSMKLGEFTEYERAALQQLGLQPGFNLAVISPDSRPHYLAKLGAMRQYGVWPKAIASAR